MVRKRRHVLNKGTGREMSSEVQPGCVALISTRSAIRKLTGHLDLG